MKTTQTQFIMRALIFSALTVLVLILSLVIRGIAFSEAYQSIALFAVMLVMPAFRRFDLFVSWHFGTAGSIGNSILIRWAGIASALVFIVLATNGLNAISTASMAIWLIATPFTFLLLHWICRYGIRAWFPDLIAPRRAVIVFVNPSSRRLAERLLQSDDYELIGYFEDREPARYGGVIAGIPMLGRSSEVVDYAVRTNIDVVFVVLPDEGASRTLQLLEALGDTTASVYYLPDLLTFNLLQSRLGEIEGFPAIEVAETPFYSADGLLKKCFDLVFASLVVIAVAPILILIGILIKLDSKGPVIFLQKRYGLNGASFSVYKFRTMTVADRSGETQHVTRDDSRVTRIGRLLRRTSLDELPQFLNVLRGEMSVVGPRPHSVAHNELYRREVKRYMVRHKVKPGVTGWAQVNGLRGEISQLENMQQRIQYDLEYIRDWTPLLDVRIILMTVIMVFRDKNAY